MNSFQVGVIRLPIFTIINMFYVFQYCCRWKISTNISYNYSQETDGHEGD